MLSLLRDLGRNLVSGVRLIFGQPVSRLDFRIGVTQLLVLFAFAALVNIGVDWVRSEPGAEFTAQGFVGEAFFGAVLMLIAAVLSRLFRQPGYALALPVILLSSEWPTQIVRVVATVATRLDPALLASAGSTEKLVAVLFWVWRAWMVYWLWRAGAVALAPARPHFVRYSLVALALLLSPIALETSLLPDISWWSVPEESDEATETTYPSPASEEALVAQPQLLDDALAALEDQRPGKTDLYFVGFAPYSEEDVFLKDMEVARDLFDSRFDTAGRSVLLVNNPSTILDLPLATVSNLRETLNEMGATIDRDEDVVMLYLESHGSKNYELVTDFPPLELDSLTPALLRELLDKARIKWRIIVVSACYSGGYIEPLREAHTLVITASAANRTSFGCGTESNATYFADAFFQHALRFEDSFLKAFEQARASIAAREKEQNMSPPSDPQIFVGDAMAQKLPKLEQALRSRRADLAMLVK